MEDKITNQNKSKTVNSPMVNKIIEKISHRPKEEVDYLYNKVCERIDQIDYNFRYLDQREKEVYNASLQEKRDLVKLQTLLQFIQFHKVLPGYTLECFGSCKIITRHFGEQDWPLHRIYVRSKERLRDVQEKIENYSNSEEFVELQKLHSILAWYYDDLKDCFIGLHFSWNLFPKKIRDQFSRRELKDAFNTPDRKPVEEELAREMTELKRLQITEELKSNFSFLKDRRRPTKKDVIKAQRTVKNTARAKKGRKK